MLVTLGAKEQKLIDAELTNFPVHIRQGQPVIEIAKRFIVSESIDDVRAEWNPIMTPEECARYLSISKVSLYRLVKGRAIPVSPLSLSKRREGQRFQMRFKRDVIDAWVKKKTIKDVSTAYDELTKEKC